MKKAVFSLRIVAIVVFLALLVLPAMLAQEAEAPERVDGWFGRSTMLIPGYTDRGNWYGSWWYVNRDYHVALWVRPGDEGPELKIQLFRLGGLEHFTTDWSGDADYVAKGGTGTFRLEIIEADDNRVQADWYWNLEFPGSFRREEGAIKIYRSGDGRHMIFLMVDGEATLRRGDDVGSAPLDQTWTFRKASRRLINWDEFPF